MIRSIHYSDDVTTSPQADSRIAFLLAQVGDHVSNAFALRIREAGLTPSDAGVLRVLGRSAGMSQRQLADRLRAAPSRVVALIDSLQERGLVDRVRSATDRRNYELHLTKAGKAMLQDLGRLAAEHETAMSAGLTGSQRDELANLLRLVAEHQRLDEGIHPGYGNRAGQREESEPTRH